jgi:hypothetical protein
MQVPTSSSIDEVKQLHQGTDFEEFCQLLSSLFTAVEQRRDAVLQAAAARFLVATAPGLAMLPTLQQSLFMELLTQESLENKLFEWVEAGALPMCAYAQGTYIYHIYIYIYIYHIIYIYIIYIYIYIYIYIIYTYYTHTYTYIYACMLYIYV